MVNAAKSSAGSTTNKLRSNNELELVTIHNLMIDHQYASIDYRYKCSDPENPSRTPGEMISAGMYVEASCNLIPEECKAGVQSRRRNAYVNAVWPSPMVSVACK